MNPKRSVHLAATPLGYINLFGSTCTITGTLAFTIFAYADRLGLASCNGSMFDISGATVTGKRYDVSSNGVIFTSGGGQATSPEALPAPQLRVVSTHRRAGAVGSLQ